LNEEIEKYQLALFKPSTYVLRQHKDQYQGETNVRNFSQENREKFLIGMMKVNFLKRLESSVKSFAITMERTVNKIEDLQARLGAYKKLRDGKPEDLQASLFLDGGRRRRRIARSVRGGHPQIPHGTHGRRPLAGRPNRDKQQLSMLAESADGVGPERDAKLEELKTIISTKVTQPSTNNRGEANRKVIVFCAFADTAAYLYEQLEDWAMQTLKVNIALSLAAHARTGPPWARLSSTRSSPTSPRAPSSAPRCAACRRAAKSTS
jgi:hypothetical protein